MNRLRKSFGVSLLLLDDMVQVPYYCDGRTTHSSMAISYGFAE
jgi:hypothetical protein